MAEQEIVSIKCRATSDCDGRTATRVGTHDLLGEARREAQIKMAQQGLSPQEQARLEAERRQALIRAGAPLPTDEDRFMAQIADGGSHRARFRCMKCERVFEIPY